MELNLNKSIMGILTFLILVALPLVILVIGLAFEVVYAWYYVLAITWFACGVIFYTAIN